MLRPWIPEELRRELVVGEAVPSETTQLEDILSRTGVRPKRSLKEQIFGTAETSEGEAIDGPLYGQSVLIRPGSSVKGDVYARRELKITRGSTISGFAICPVVIDIVGSELGGVVGSQITMKNPCTIHGKVVTDRDLSLPPDSRVAAITCSGKKLEIGEKSELGSIRCNGVTILGEGVKVLGELSSGEVRLRPGCQVGWLTSNGDVSIPEQTSLGNLSTDGSVKVDAAVKMSKLYASGDVELLSGGNIGELRCRNLAAAGKVVVGKLRATGAVTVGGDTTTFHGEFLSAGGDVNLPDGAEVGVLSSKGNVVLDSKCRVKYLVAGSLRTMNDLDGGAFRCYGPAEIGSNCRVGSLHTKGDIRLGEGFCSSGWTVFSEKGTIQGTGPVRLGDSQVEAKAAFRYKGGSILSGLIEKDLSGLIDSLEGPS